MAEAIPKHFKPKFTNETALHLVIARHYKAGGADAAMTEERCIDHLRYLIDNGPSNLVDVHTTGTFFSMALGAPNASGKPVPAGKAPYGETALNFAVCFNMPRVVEFLVKYAGADLTEGDSVNEWTPMHMAVMHGNAAMADSVNNLLIIGFYLVNFGFMLLFLSTGTPPERGLTVAEHLSWKLGVVVIVLGVMHLINLIVLNGLRNRGLSSTPPPIHKA